MERADFTEIVSAVKEKGFLFLENYFSPEYCLHLKNEVAGLDLEFGDHLNHPIWPGSKREVRQLHSRAYLPIDHPDVPVATKLCYDLAQIAKSIPELEGWLLSEIGYQLYRQDLDFISPHRDRRNDRLLSLTITISGQAWVKCYEPIDDPDDYRNLRQIDQFLTKPGAAMFLRAPGLGNGNQVIHEVMPPENGDRLILNLRMRPNILPQP